MRIFYLAIFCFIFSVCKSQNGDAEINLSQFNSKLTAELFNKKLNELRQSKGLTILLDDKILSEAAKDQADYQQKNHFLTHNQKEKIKENPKLRVVFYNGTHDAVGENCIKIPLKTPFKPKYKKNEITVTTYNQLAEALFLGWKNSPGHYKNMIEPRYDMQGIAFSIDLDSNYIYSAQVFSTKPFVPSLEFLSPINAYDVKEGVGNLCAEFESAIARKALSTFQMVMGRDSIYVRCEDLVSLKQLFNKATDAIYFDLVQRKQFVCENNNLLHGSPVFDGKMLKPILFADIFKRNKARDKMNLMASVCPIPKQALDEKVQINYGFVKNGASCNYIYPVNVPNGNLRMLDLHPKWIFNDRLELKPDSFEGNLTFRIPFERNETALNEKRLKQLKDKLEIYKTFITSVNLKTFSSIEGNAKVNLKLQNERATEITTIIKGYTSYSTTITNQEYENWDEFFELIKHTTVSYLSKLSKEKIKEKLRSKSLLDSLDFLLRKNRTAELTIGLKAKIDENSDPYLILGAYQKSIEAGDSLKAFMQQNKLLDYIATYKFNKGDILPVEIPKTRKFLPHLTNYLAIAITDDELFYSTEARLIARNIYDIDTNYLPVKFNCCIMALKYLHEFNDTIFPVTTLENYMNSCYRLGTADDSVIVNHMWLNYSLLSLYNNWATHQYQYLNKHLSNVRKYYPGAKISELEAMKLGKLFNLYARYDWTLELLNNYIPNTKNDDIEFLYVETGAGRGNPLNVPNWETLLKRCKKMNMPRFYDWIDKENWQLLRNDLVKKEFCEIKFK